MKTDVYSQHLVQNEPVKNVKQYGGGTLRLLLVES